VLAEARFSREATVARLEQLALAEVQALTGVLADPGLVRMHSVGVR
jgi:tRNA-(ms[2]io[6]A)-hydroxylase